MDNLQAKLDTIKKESGRINKEIRRQIFIYVGAGLGLVAGLAWNEAIKSLIDYLFPLSKNTLLAKFSYALIITLIVVLVSIYLSRLFKKEEI